MPNLLSQIFGLREGSSGRRPQWLEFDGINYDCPQSQNLVCFLPMWEGAGIPCFDQGPSKLVGQPTLGPILRTQDPYFGDVYLGDGAVRGYKIPYSQLLNFGIGPQAFSLSFWYKTPPKYSPAPDAYLFTYDDPSSTPTAFAGYACSFDTGGVIACNTGNSSVGDAGHKTLPGASGFDGNWHFLTFSHQPSGNTAVFQAVNTYYLDGQLNVSYNSDADVGAVSGARFMTIGTDDDGVSQPFGSGDITHGPIGCYFCDLRFYRGALGASEVAQMWHPDTRWDLYWYKRKQWFIPQPPVIPLSFVPSWPWQATNKLIGGGIT